MKPLRLYEITLQDDRRPSPFCWRSKYALAHKELPFETIPIGFTDLPALYGGQHKTVPILDDNGRIVGDSWAIADYLDETYPDRPRIFGSPTERALCQFLEASLFVSSALLMVSFCVKDIHDHAIEKDRAYFRASREARLGRTLEEVVAGREERLDALRAGLEPIRLVLKSGVPFLSGAQPGYADYIAAGFLLWPASVITRPVLRSDDPLLAWLARVQDLFGGLGRRSPLNPIAG